jgi:hypothetical protein
MYCPFLSASYRRGDIRENLISAARGQRWASIPVRAVNRPRPSAVLAGVFLPSIGVTRYSALPNFLPRGRVPALTGRRSIERTSLPSAVSFDRPRPDAPDREAARLFIFSRELDQRGLKCCECPLLVKCASVVLAPKVAVVSPGRFIRLAHGVLDLACLTEGRRRFAPPRSYPRNIRPRLSSPGRCASIPRGSQESRGLAALYCVPAPAGCGSIASGL